MTQMSPIAARLRSCSWTFASLRLRAPHIGLPPDDAVLFLLHLPPRAELRLLERPGNEIALRLLAAVVAQKLELGDGFHAFGDAAQTHAVGERDDRERDRFVTLVLLEPVHEALVDFYTLDRQPREIRQA